MITWRDGISSRRMFHVIKKLHELNAGMDRTLALWSPWIFVSWLILFLIENMMDKFVVVAGTEDIKAWRPIFVKLLQGTTAMCPSRVRYPARVQKRELSSAKRFWCSSRDPFKLDRALHPGRSSTHESYPWRAPPNLPGSHRSYIGQSSASRESWHSPTYYLVMSLLEVWCASSPDLLVRFGLLHSLDTLNDHRTVWC